MKYAQILYSFVLSYLSPFARKVLTLTLIASLILPDVVRAMDDDLQRSRSASARQSLLREDSAGVPQKGFWSSLEQLAGSTLWGRHHDSTATRTTSSEVHRQMNQANAEIQRAQELKTGSAHALAPLSEADAVYAQDIGLEDLNTELTIRLNPDDPTDRVVDKFLKYTYKIRNESWKWEDIATLVIGGGWGAMTLVAMLAILEGTFCNLPKVGVHGFRDIGKDQSNMNALMVFSAFLLIPYTLVRSIAMVREYLESSTKEFSVPDVKFHKIPVRGIYAALVSCGALVSIIFSEWLLSNAVNRDPLEDNPAAVLRNMPSGLFHVCQIALGLDMFTLFFNGIMKRIDQLRKPYLVNLAFQGKTGATQLRENTLRKLKIAARNIERSSKIEEYAEAFFFTLPCFLKLKEYQVYEGTPAMFNKLFAGKTRRGTAVSLENSPENEGRHKNVLLVKYLLPLVGTIARSYMIYQATRRILPDVTDEASRTVLSGFSAVIGSLFYGELESDGIGATLKRILERHASSSTESKIVKIFRKTAGLIFPILQTLTVATPPLVAGTIFVVSGWTDPLAVGTCLAFFGVSEIASYWDRVYQSNATLSDWVRRLFQTRQAKRKQLLDFVHHLYEVLGNMPPEVLLRLRAFIEVTDHESALPIPSSNP